MKYQVTHGTVPSSITNKENEPGGLILALEEQSAVSVPKGGSVAAVCEAAMPCDYLLHGLRLRQRRYVAEIVPLGGERKGSAWGCMHIARNPELVSVRWPTVYNLLYRVLVKFYAYSLFNF